MAKKPSRMTVSQRADGITIRATGTFAIELLERLAGEAIALPQEKEKTLDIGPVGSVHTHKASESATEKEQ